MSNHLKRLRERLERAEKFEYPSVGVGAPDLRALIADYDEMREALRWARDAFDALHKEGLLGGSPEAEAEFRDNTALIRAVLAKAGGK